MCELCFVQNLFTRACQYGGGAVEHLLGAAPLPLDQHQLPGHVHDQAGGVALHLWEGGGVPGVKTSVWVEVFQEL